VISTIVMIAVVVLLSLALGAARRSWQRQLALQRENETMLRELQRHRDTVHSILRELQNP
jgi:type II secretory pathway pseudopilin PulG